MADGSHNNVNLPDLGKVGRVVNAFDHIVNGGIRLARHMLVQFNNLIPFRRTNCLILVLYSIRKFLVDPPPSRYISQDDTINSLLKREGVSNLLSGMCPTDFNKRDSLRSILLDCLL